MRSRRDARQREGDHRGEELQADRIVVVSEKLAYLQMLFDPAKQQFDPPAALVKRGDFDSGAGKIIGHEGDRGAADRDRHGIHPRPSTGIFGLFAARAPAPPNAPKFAHSLAWNAAERTHEVSVVAA